ncbi:LptA/OstA family protein [Leptospira paudalimensis]|uniref:LptA/OstA family protein n=1 Tax=Leptospira paudalimensis TaxID=2950024 RepID=A0ABT3M803_9LEPT|nr:LptA/OstA family protein [Leptospira paudalimensis]MCW7504152.1 LptA/OstA family protein [Leptospira paudalimensis]
MRQLVVLSIFFGFVLQLKTSPIPILYGNDDFFKADETILKNEDKKSKKDKIPIIWGGSSLTQEERVLNGFPVKVFILGGGAYIMHKSIKLSAKEIEIIGEEALIGNLKGQVIVEDFQNGVTLTATKGVYDKVAGTVSLENHPILTQKKDGKVVRIKCQSILRNLEEAKTTLAGKVVVTSEEFQVFGEDAVFSEKEDRIDLKGEPFLFSENRFLIGQTLSYFVKEGSIQLDGDATIYQVSYENKKDKETDTVTKERVLTLFSGKTLTHLNKGKETVTSMNGDAFMYRKNSEFKADLLESKKSNKEIKATGNVSYLDKENGYRMEGGILFYDKEKSYSYLTETPKIVFLNKKDLVERGQLTSVFIERFDDKNETVARGDVQVETQSAKATGEFATYYEKKDELVLEGNPTLVRDSTKVSAGKIILFPKSDKALLTDGLKVIPNGEKK